MRPSSFRDSGSCDPLSADVTQLSHVTVVADARLDNLTELRDELDAEAGSSSTEVLARAYLKWGQGFPEHLAGDFAIVLWDAIERQLLAVRDPFGVKSLFYRRAPERIWFASDQERILRTFNGFPDVDDSSVVEYLLGIYRSLDGTFFREIRRVPAGHILTVRSSGVQVTRYWKPIQSFIDRTKAQPTREHIEEFRRLFRRAILNRITPSAGAVVHVSGGIDSSAIAVACDLLLRDSDIAPPIIGAAAVFPNLKCDEGLYIGAVEKKVHFPIERWDGTLPEPIDIVEPAPDCPGARCVFIDGMLGDLEIAKRSNCSVILSGNGGDELTIGTGTARDMIAAREWTRVIERLFGYKNGRSRSSRVKSLAGQLLPYSVRAWRARSRARVTVPGWLVPELRPIAQDLLQPEIPSTDGSYAQAHVWNRLNSQQLVHGIEAHQRQGLPFAVEYTFPLLDRELVRLVVSIASGYWPAGTRPHQRALAHALPREIEHRSSKMDLTPALANRIRRAGPLIERQYLDGLWASKRYVLPEVAAAEWRAFDWQTADGLQCRRMWSVVTLEAWLRRVFGYSSR